MQELVKALDEVTDDHPREWLYPDLQKAAERWAVHSLSTYRGKVLTAALEISQAMAEFNIAFEDKGE